MTLAGEQPGDDRFAINEVLHYSNRRYWNGWATQALDDDEKATLIKDGRVTKAELEPLTGEEYAEIEAALVARCRGAEIPDPRDVPKFDCMEVEVDFCTAGYLFPRGASFLGVTFSRRADFRSATFFGPADFEGAIFSGDAVFLSTTFSHVGCFECATFSYSATFGSATFSDRADFESAIFSGDAYFGSATFSDTAYFRSATLSGAPDFNDATFESGTTFRQLAFRPLTASEIEEGGIDIPSRPRPPTFFGATLHEDTDWTDVVWPDPPADRDDAIRFRRAYERLKLVMADQNKFADEHFFLRKELECREIEEPGSLRTWASKAFGLLSDYGWSVERPLAALGIAWAGGAVLLFLGEWADFWLGTWPEPEVRPPEFLGPGQAAALSFSNLFAFLGLGMHILRDELTSLTAFSEIVAGAQTVSGPILLFLLALGLRNRFRIK